MNGKKTFDRIITIVLLAACITLAIAIYLKYAAASSSPDDSIKMPAQAENTGLATNVSAMTVASGTFTKTVSASGTVTNKTKSQTLCSTIAGTVKNLKASEGAYLNKGDTICTVDPSKPGTVYNQVEIKAIASGRITDVNVIEGEEISSGTVLVTIQPESDLKIQVHLPQKYYSLINDGTKATFATEVYSGQTFDAVISEKEDAIDTDDWTFIAEFDSVTSGILIEGMYVKMDIQTLSIDNCISIPQKAINTSSDEQYVYVIEDSKAVKRTITTGETSNSQTVVTNGLSDGDIVITAGTVAEQSTVKIV
jgi:multidrug efflux pump subunit AcrA (membrane-fusion protein)